MRRAVIAGFAWLTVCGATACGTHEVGSFTPAESELLSTPSAAAIAMPDGTVVGEQDGRLVAIDPRHLELDPVVVGPAAAIGEVFTAVPIRGAVLVLASGGTFVVRDAAWVPSPLGDALDGPITGAVMLQTATGRGVGDLWITTASSLYRVRDEVVERLDLGEPLAGAMLAGVRRADGPALWVRLPDRVLEVWQDRTGALRTAELVLPIVPTTIAGDETGTGWLVIEGRLHSLGADRRLVDRGVAVERIVGAPSSEALWAFGPAGAWMHTGGQLYAVEGAGLDATDTLALAPDGSLFVAGATLRRIAPRRDVTIEGAADGALLVTPVDFTLVLQGQPVIEATIDGNPVAIAADPPRIQLVPAELGDGEHTLEVRVTYDDGTLPVEDRRTFQVVTSATWGDDVEPIYQAACAECHGAAGPAITRLDQPEGWESKQVEILINVEEGRMPLNRPPLSDREIALIQAWMVSGFPD